MGEVVTRDEQALSLIRPVTTISEVLEVHEFVRDMLRKVLKNDEDYGVIPGTPKPSLYKPGAEKICLAFGCAPHYELIESEIDHSKEVKWTKKKKDYKTKAETIETGVSLGVYRYVYKCKIIRSDGRVVGEGQGVCSTMESKYIDRPRDCENTACKMSQKRAFVAAVLNAFGLSGLFTSDMGDDDYTKDKNNGNKSQKLKTEFEFVGDSFFVKTDFNDKESQTECKKLGAKWHAASKRWEFSSNNLKAIERFGPKQQTGDEIPSFGDEDAPPPEIPFQ